MPREDKHARLLRLAWRHRRQHLLHLLGRHPDVHARLLRLACRAAIAEASDAQLENPQATQLAGRLARTGVKTAQVRNLENLAFTTDKVSDLLDFLKKQV